MVYKNSNQIFSFLKNSTGMYVGLFDLEGNLLDANKGLREIFGDNDGNPGEALSNPSFQDLLALPVQKEAAFDGMITTGKKPPFQSFRGQVYRFPDQILLLGDIDGKELVLLNNEMARLNQDLNNTQRALVRKKRQLKQTLAELKETQAMLVHSEKMNALGRLVAGVAHEINNPVSFIVSNMRHLRSAFDDFEQAFNELAQEQKDEVDISAIREKYDLDFLSEDTVDMIQSCSDGLERIKKIVDNLRSFSRLDENIQKCIPLKECIDSVMNIARTELENSKIEVSCQFDCNPVINCKPAELNQVFMNILMNSIYAMPDGGKFHIHVSENEKFVHLSFSDSGTGLDKQVQDKIFDPFFTTKPVGQGTGLGLFLSRRIIVDEHQGTIEAKSSEFGGTVIKICLPKNV
jgi:signal transduction histidine kinase